MTVHRTISGWRAVLMPTSQPGQVRTTTLARVILHALALGIQLVCYPVNAADRTTALDHVPISPEGLSVAARNFAGWIIHSNDAGSSPYLIVDKIKARVYAFDAQGVFRGGANVLLGLAIGDDSVPGIGQKKLAEIRPMERTTPAGRFVASLDRNLAGDEILWIDYDAAISLHRVITSNKSEYRAERLASPSANDNRISYGCINVPVKFFDQVVRPLFKTDGIVYVMPETRPARQTFASYDRAVGSRSPASPGTGAQPSAIPKPGNTTESPTK